MNATNSIETAAALGISEDGVTGKIKGKIFIQVIRIIHFT
jgi:hypothetical protein